MKRIISCIMALVLCFACVGMCHAEDQEGTFEPELLGQFELSADEWYKTNETRALLTLFSVMELINQNVMDSDTALKLVMSDSFVSCIGSALIVVCAGDDGGLYMIFDTEKNTLKWSYSSGKAAISDYAEIMEAEDVGYYYNSLEDLGAVAEVVNSVVDQ